MEFGQFCPVSKALEVLGERWTLMVTRELLMGSTRFNELQRGLGMISPTILTKRLNELAEAGIIIRRKIPGQRGYEYLVTDMGRELLPIIKSIGDWGMRWTRSTLPDTELDLEHLMVYLERAVVPSKLPGTSSVIKFHFTDIEEPAEWWILVNGDTTDVCIKDPGKDVDVYLTTDVRTMIQLWMGEADYGAAVRAGSLKLVGPTALTRDVKSWLTPSVFAGIAPAR